MSRRKRWADLSRTTRGLIISVAVLEGVLKFIALLDLRRRPAAEIRGSKAKWAAAVGLINSAGAVPIAYLVYGRHKLT